MIDRKSSGLCESLDARRVRAAQREYHVSWSDDVGRGLDRRPFIGQARLRILVGQVVLPEGPGFFFVLVLFLIFGIVSVAIVETDELILPRGELHVLDGLVVVVRLRGRRVRGLRPMGIDLADELRQVAQ